jgi:hypothetical protein
LIWELAINREGVDLPKFRKKKLISKNQKEGDELRRWELGKGQRAQK